MRVIAGKARRLPLKTLREQIQGPLRDRIKETLFNILQPELLDCRFLDLFSGSGAIGIEALSRGASHAVFVEKNPRACACIRDNLAFTKLASDGQVMNMDALQRCAPWKGGRLLTVSLWIRPTVWIWSGRSLNILREQPGGRGYADHSGG